MALSGEAKRAWRKTYATQQRAHNRAWHAKKAAEKAQAILALPDLEAASHYLDCAGFHGKAQAIVAEWGRQHPDAKAHMLATQASADRRYRQRVRNAAMELLGGRCECCGIDVPEVLEFDHRVPVLRRTNGIRNRDTAHSARDILSGNAAAYQLLCANCHALKTKMNGEHAGGVGVAWDEVVGDLGWDAWMINMENRQ